MNIQRQWTFPMALLLALTVGLATSEAQVSAARSSLGGAPAGYPMAAPPQMVPGMPIGAPGVYPAGYPGGGPAAAFDPATGTYYAPPGVLPVVEGPDPNEGGATPPMPMPIPMDEETAYEAEMYDEEYYASRERLGLCAALLPYDEGGICAPRWWDVYVDAVRFRRENVSRTVNFSTDGILGDTVLSSNSLDFNDAYGFRAGIAAQLGAGSNVEFNFLGALNFHARADVDSPTNNLFHTFSDFGSNPFLGFQETDQAYHHDIAYSSSLNSFEMSYRRRWQGRNCRLQGSWLGGIRYISMNEDFTHHTLANINGNPAAPRFMNYTTSTINSLTGFQIGGDAWLTVIPGLRVGGELKAGLYGNYTHQNTSIFATSIPNGLFERTSQNGAAFVSELNLGFTYRVNYHWTVRASYDFLYLDGVALAIENFNSGPPFVAGQRPLFFNNNGDVFLHGATLGLEYVW